LLKTPSELPAETAWARVCWYGWPPLFGSQEGAVCAKPGGTAG